MAGMEFQAGLALDQIGDAPTGPQPSPISQRLGSFLQASAQLFELLGPQTRFAPSSAGFFQTALARFLPVVVPASARLARGSGAPRHFGLAKSLLKELGGLEAALFQRCEVPSDAFRISHAQP